MIKKVLFVCLSSLLVIGCSSGAKTGRDTSVIAVVDNIHDVGEGNGHIVIQFFDKEVIKRQVTVRFPSNSYETTFDLCPESGKYMVLESVRSPAGASKKIPNYQPSKVDCTSRLKIYPSTAGLFYVDYYLTFLEGFRVTTQQGFEVEMPITRTYGLNSFYSADSKPQFRGSFSDDKSLVVTINPVL